MAVREVLRLQLCSGFISDASSKVVTPLGPALKVLASDSDLTPKEESRGHGGRYDFWGTFDNEDDPISLLHKFKDKYVAVMCIGTRDKFGNPICQVSTTIRHISADVLLHPVEMLPYCSLHREYKHCCDDSTFVFNLFRLSELPFAWDDPFPAFDEIR
jgi:hypothetical protein